jgi:hypothetical protein
MLVDYFTQMFKEWKANRVVIVFVVIEYFVFVAINGCCNHEFNLVLEVDEIGIVEQETIRITHFIEDAYVWIHDCFFISTVV